MMIDPSTQRENIICVSTASFCHKASNGSHVFFVRVGGTVCKCFHLSHTHTHTHTHRTDYGVTVTHDGFPEWQNPFYHLFPFIKYHNEIHPLRCVTRLLHLTTSLLFSSPLTSPSSFKSRIQLLQIYYILICGFTGQTDTYYKKEIYFELILLSVSWFALFIHLSDCLCSGCQCFAMSQHDQLQDTQLRLDFIMPDPQWFTQGNTHYENVFKETAGETH